MFAQEAHRFRAAVADRHGVDTTPRRTQDRTRATIAAVLTAPFTNAPDTDFTLAANRDWIGDHLRSWAEVTMPSSADLAEVEAAVAAALAA